jgi:hypothetical protein
MLVGSRVTAQRAHAFRRHCVRIRVIVFNNNISVISLGLILNWTNVIPVYDNLWFTKIIILCIMFKIIALASPYHIITKGGLGPYITSFIQPRITCTMPGKWAVRGIDLASFCYISIGLWSCSDGLIIVLYFILFS